MDDSITLPKVAQVLAGAAFGGAENFYTRLVCALAEAGQIEQRAFTRPNEHREHHLQQAGVDTCLHRLGGKLDILGNYRYRRALQKWQADIVITYMNRASYLTPKGDYALVARLGHYYDLKYYRHCDYWIGITQGICRHMIDGGFPADRVFHIPNFIDETIAQPLPRDSFNSPADQPLLLAAGRLHRNKGFDILLRALVDVPNAILWLAGEGPERNALEQQAKELKIVDRLRFLGWRNDINALMCTADIFICPSRHEGLGSIIPESWYNQCPIIAARSQGPGELIAHRQNGLLVDIDDDKQLADAINELIASKDFAYSIQKNGKAEYQNKYSKHIIIQQYLNLIHNLVKSHEYER
ncbi:MAG: glycosyltransferase [Pseudomonadota bacterium]